MQLQRQHFLLSYLKTLSVGQVGVSNSRTPALQPGAPSEQPVRGNSDWFVAMYDPVVIDSSHSFGIDRSSSNCINCVQLTATIIAYLISDTQFNI